MSAMKLAVVGGGSTYTPELVDGLARLGDQLDVAELVDRQRGPEPGEAVDELGRVGRAAPDDSELHAGHPFTPVRVMPSTKTFCARKNTTRTGTIARIVAAIVRFHCTW